MKEEVLQEIESFYWVSKNLLIIMTTTTISDVKALTISPARVVWMTCYLIPDTLDDGVP